MKNENKAAEVKTVAKAEKKSILIKEEEVTNFINNRSLSEIINEFAEKEWNGQSLEEDKVYHLKHLGGIRIAIIQANRRTFKRGLKMMKACKETGMTTPAILVNAQVVRDWGLTPVDPSTGKELTADELKVAYCVMEGHGRLDGWMLDLAYTQKNGGIPFDYHFVFKHYESAEDFGKAYVSTNADMTRTSSKDRLSIAGARSSNPQVISYLNKIRYDKTIAKASLFWTFGYEPTKSEITKLIYGEADAPTFEQDVIEGLVICYEVFKERFKSEGSQKIYRGVSAAQWCADRINKAKDKKTTAKTISEKVLSMSDDTYSIILTATTNWKKHLTRDQIIKTALDKMMAGK